MPWAKQSLIACLFGRFACGSSAASDDGAGAPAARQPVGVPLLYERDGLLCGAMLGISKQLGGRTEILACDGMISEIGRSVHRPDGAEVIDLPDHTVGPGFIDNHPPHDGRLRPSPADAPILGGQGREGAQPRPRVHALRLYHRARPAQHGSRVLWA